MAGGMDLGTGGKGGKKPLDAAINLVPFIDLMAVTISFLIMTAVWTQIGRLQVSRRRRPDGDPTPEQDDKTVPVTLLITEKELRLTVGTSTFDPIPITRDAKQQDRPDQARRERFKEREGAAARTRRRSPLQTEDAVRYEDLVRIIDECIGRRACPTSRSPPAMRLRGAPAPWPSRFPASGTASASSTRRCSGTARHGKKATNADLLITPLVDMFVIIVLFLIANFSATGEVLMMTKDIQLPEARQREGGGDGPGGHGLQRRQVIVTGIVDRPGRGPLPRRLPQHPRAGGEAARA